MCDCLAVMLQMSNFDFTSQTVHPTYGGYRLVKRDVKSLITNMKSMQMFVQCLYWKPLMLQITDWPSFFQSFFGTTRKVKFNLVPGIDRLFGFLCQQIGMKKVPKSQLWKSGTETGTWNRHTWVSCESSYRHVLWALWFLNILYHDVSWMVLNLDDASVPLHEFRSLFVAEALNGNLKYSHAARSGTD